MKVMRGIGFVSGACGLTLMLAGPAMASSAVVETTGPGSSVAITIHESTDTSVTNTNVVQVSSDNRQQATSGEVSASRNTSVGGGVSSGEASNSNTTATAVVIANQPVQPAGGQGAGESQGGVGGSGGNAGSPGGSAGGSGGSVSGGAGSAGPVAHGSVLAAATGGAGGGAAMLPVTGPSSTVDVAALRAAWRPDAAAAPAVSAAKPVRSVSAGLLVAASLASLLGAVGSLVFARRREGRV